MRILFEKWCMSQAGALNSGGGGGSGIQTIDGDSGSMTGSTVTISGSPTGLTTTAAGSTMNFGGTLIVGNGGTGRATSTAYAVICGGTTSTAAQQSVAALGAAGTVLTSNGAGVLPSFQGAAGSGALTLIQTQTAAAQTTLNFTTGITTTYNNYRIAISNFGIAMAGTYFLMSLSTDGGATWINTNYNNGQAGLMVIDGFSGGGVPAGTAYNIVLDVLNVTSGTGAITNLSVGSSYDSINGFIATVFTIGTQPLTDAYTVTPTVANGFQFVMDNGSAFSGTFSLYGYSK